VVERRELNAKGIRRKAATDEEGLGKQKAESRKQKTEDGGQRTVVRSQWSVVSWSRRPVAIR
jgi:hypothetical protein